MAHINAIALILTILVGSCKSLQESGGLRLQLVHRDSHFSAIQSKPETHYHRLVEARDRTQQRVSFLKSKATDASSGAYRSRTGLSNGEYLMELELGTPPQKFQMILDTGSDMVWLQSSTCHKCADQKGPLFNPSASTTFNSYTCEDQPCKLARDGLDSACSSHSICPYEYSYADNSNSQGIFASDTLSLTSVDGSKLEFEGFSFGCGDNQTGDFSGAAGLIGFDNSSLSFPGQLGSIIGHKFSYCLVSFQDSLTKTSSMFFGSAADLEGQGVQKTKIFQGPIPSVYYVDLIGISVGQTNLKIAASSLKFNSAGSGGTVMDSGTPMTTFYPSSIYTAIKGAFVTAVNLPQIRSKRADLCFNISGSSVSVFPSLTFHFDSADFKPPVQNYVSVESDTACLAMEAGGPGPSIIGNIMQQNFHFSFDVDQNTMSFVEAQCDTF